MITELALAHAGRIDAHAPGLLAGLHVTGSPALDDYVPGVSDLDLVGVLSRVPDEADLAALAKAHVDPSVDAVYVQPDDLTRPAADLVRPWGRDGELRTTEPAYLTPVLWDQLNRYSITVRGDRPKACVTPEEVADYCRGNLVAYWQPLVEQLGAALDAGVTVPADTVLWVALGPARLWHTLRTGEIVGKSQAVNAAAAHWPDLAAPLAVLVEARHGRAAVEPEHGLAAVELGRRVLADG
ncbi:MAG: hypothetical protein ABIQ18_15310 [Umezawaea sp.]